MFIAQLPNWLDRLERRIGWFSLPNLSLYFVVAQGFGFLFFQIDPNIISKMILHPYALKQGEWWRAVSFLAVPLSANIFFQLIVIWFLFFIVNIVESSIGEFKTTFYLFLSVLFSNIFALAFDYPILSAGYVELVFFLAAAVLVPDMEILLFFILPVKIKYLGYISLAFVLYSFFMYDWLGRLYLLFMLGNFLLFFYPGLIAEIRYRIKRLKK